MVSISTRVDRQGFWYLVDATDDSNFTLSYIVIGTGGRQGSGEIEGLPSNLNDWQYVEVGFPVLHVGITDLTINHHLSGDAVVQKRRPQADLLSRRRSIKTITSMLLAGWAMIMFPVAMSHGRTLIGNTKPDPESGDNPTNRFNPYATERFNPYSANTGGFFNPY